MLIVDAEHAAIIGSDFSITRMTEHDLLEVVEIEEASGLSRWGWEAYHAELQQKGGTLMFVASAANPAAGVRLSGFIASRLIGDELHVNNVAVRDAYRRAGIGRKLLERVLTAARKSGASAAFLEVRASNEAAKALYSRCGFCVAGQRRNYYSDPPENALLMRRIIKRSA
ncbi:MAG: [ribosomal protein S18]-alanine N-acetyltransferase [Acidobacteriota bacterium]|jgi:ribosomal-protein-alanine N-acetyltransferase|nr:[ribosomal protein S18]-alanine N-acetyltransferase [Acidobacteriota bacterium]